MAPPETVTDLGLSDTFRGIGKLFSRENDPAEGKGFRGGHGGVEKEGVEKEGAGKPHEGHP